MVRRLVRRFRRRAHGEKGWGKKKTYEHGAQQCNETLFDEYIRLLRGLQPRTFVAENVSGLVRGTAKGWFLEVLRSLKDSGYRVKARLLDAQWLGVPQMRQRIIFVGVREDLATGAGSPGAAPIPLLGPRCAAAPDSLQDGRARLHEREHLSLHEARRLRSP